MRIAFALLGAVALLPLVATQAAAAPRKYTITGTGSGSLGGTSFNNAAFTFDLFGDTTKLTNSPGLSILDPLTSATATIAGFAPATFSIATRIGVASQNVVFFSRSSSSGSNDLFDFTASGPVDLSSSFTLTGSNIFALSQFSNIATSGGSLSFTQSSSVSFSGAPAVAAAVPEPDSWALMIAGFALAGAAMRRRSVRIAFAA